MTTTVLDRLIEPLAECLTMDAGGVALFGVHATLDVPLFGRFGTNSADGELAFPRTASPQQWLIFSTAALQAISAKTETTYDVVLARDRGPFTARL